MKYLSLLAVYVLLTSCAAKALVDYEKDTNWDEYKVYQYYSDIDSGLNALDDKRIVNAIDSILSPPDYQRSDYNQFYINFFVEEYLSDSGNTVGIGIGGGGGNISVGGGVDIPIGGTVLNQKITLEFREAANGDKLIWQGIVEATIKEKASPEEKEAYFNQVIGTMLKDFPPKK